MFCLFPVGHRGGDVVIAGGSKLAAKDEGHGKAHVCVDESGYCS